MEEEAPSRHSVAELAGRFKGSAPPNDAAGHQTQEKPVRRRPPRSLQLPKTHGDEQEPPGVTSPLPAKAKRNSALIEKLQANLALSPSALLPSPKSPGFRLLAPAFPPPSPTSAPVTTVTTASMPPPTSPVVAALLTEEEGPTSFETPPMVGEGLTLSNASIKGRARHSIRRRPPSRRHRKSSSGDEVGVTNEGGDASLSSPSEDGGGGGGGGKVVKQEELKDEASTCPEKHEEDQSESREEDEKKKEGEESSSGTKEEKEEEEEEEVITDKQEEDLTEGATNTDSKEVEKMKDGVHAETSASTSTC